MTTNNNKLLVVEDDPGLQSQIRWCFEDHDDVLLAEDRVSALKQVEKHRPAVVTLDLGLPPETDNPSEGFATLEQILEINPETKVIVVTGQDEWPMVRSFAGSPCNHGVHPVLSG